MIQPKAAPLGLSWRSKTTFIVATVALGLFTDYFLYGLPVPITPYILRDRIHLPAAEIQTKSSILIAAHAIPSGLVCPLAAIFTDRFNNRKTPYIISVLILSAAVILFFLGDNVATLAFARVVQGTAGALIWVVGQAILIDTVGAENLGKAQGSINATVSIGAILAPVAGGILYERTGLWGPLGMACSLLGIDMTMRLLIIEKQTAAQFQKDLYPTESGIESSDSESGDEASEEDALLKPPAAVQADPHYIIPPELGWPLKQYPILHCCKDIRLLTTYWVTLIQAILLATLDATVPNVAIEYYEFTSLQTGFLFIPILLPILIFAPLAGRITDRRGSRAIVIWGFGLLGPILASFYFVKPGGIAQILTYAALLTCCGICLAITNVPALVDSTVVIEKYHKANPGRFGPNGPYAQISSITGLLYNSGTASGPLLAGLLKDRMGYGVMNIVMAILAVLTAVLGFFFVMGRAKDDTKKERENGE